jgi:leader peptidase (prepilin peptidase)/N-methyltransferase
MTLPWIIGSAAVGVLAGPPLRAGVLARYGVLAASLAAVGLVAGWGQRAVIVRYAVPAGEPPLRCCPDCGHQLLGARQLALAPLARCTACGSRTGPPPLAVEVTTALLLAALAARVHPGLVLAAACWLALCSVPLAFIDAAVRRLPDVLTGAALAGTALLLLAAAAAGGHWHVLAQSVLGGVALAGFYLVLAVISPSGMGMGDVKAAAALGTMLAWRGWAALIAGGFAGFLLAAVYGTALLMSRRATRKHQIPFGPFMIAGTFLVILALH